MITKLESSGGYSTAVMGNNIGMKDFVDVNTGDVEVRQGRCILRAMALGSCVAVAAYDSQAKVAGMVHVMLPGQGPQTASRDTRYATVGIEVLLERMEAEGSHRSTIEVCLVGAGNVLRNPADTICRNNIQSVTEILRERQIPIRASAVGGYDRKSVFLDTETGRISYMQAGGVERILWPLTVEGRTDTIR